MTTIGDLLPSLGPIAAELLKQLLARQDGPSLEQVLAELEDGSVQERQRLLQQQIAALALSHAHSEMRLARIEAQTTAILGAELTNMAVLWGMASETEGDLDKETEESLSDLFAQGWKMLKEAGEQYESDRKFTSKLFDQRRRFLEKLMDISQ